MSKLYRCTKHNTSYDLDEPCWACANEGASLSTNLDLVKIVDMSKNLRSEVSIVKNKDNRFVVCILRVGKKKLQIGNIIPIFGEANSIEGACRDFIDKAKGCILIRPSSIDGDKKQQIMVGHYI